LNLFEELLNNIKEDAKDVDQIRSIKQTQENKLICSLLNTWKIYVQFGPKAQPPI